MTIEQLRELIERLTADASSVTNEELTQARAFIREQHTYFKAQPASDDVIAALEELVPAFTAVKTVMTERETAAAELETQRQDLLNDLDEPTVTPVDQVIETDTQADPVAAEESPVPDITPVGDAPADPAPEAVPEPIAASGRPARKAPIGTFKAAGKQVVVRAPTEVITADVVAAGGSSGFLQGQRLESSAQLAQAFTAQLRAMATGRGGTGEKVYVANVKHTYPESRQLRAADWVGNFTKIEDLTSDQALTAAGGLCAPPQTLYDVQVLGSVARPIRDALARFQVDRGAIQFRPNSSAATALTTGTGTGVDTWTATQDGSPAGDLKGCYVVDCPALQYAEVQAIYLCLEFSNVTARFDPETTAANIQQGQIAHARRAENELLRALQAGSKVLSAPQVLGTTRDVLANLDKAVAYYRNRHRLDSSLSLTFLLPAWVLYMMRTDLARQIASGDWQSALGVTNGMIMTWFGERGVNPVFHLDGQIGGTSEAQTLTETGAPTGGTFTLTFAGQTTAPLAYNATAAQVKSALEALSTVNFGAVTTTGGPLNTTPVVVTFGGGQFELTSPSLMTTNSAGLTGGTTPAVTAAITTTTTSTTVVSGVSIASQVYANAAAGSAVPRYPTQVDSLLFATGTKLFLDGGNLDLGLVRDSTLNARNRYRQFSESFEGVADRGIENLRLVMTVASNGTVSGTKDISAVLD